MQGISRNASQVVDGAITVDNTNEVLRLLGQAKAAALEEIGLTGDKYDTPKIVNHSTQPRASTEIFWAKLLVILFSFTMTY